MFDRGEVIAEGLERIQRLGIELVVALARARNNSVRTPRASAAQKKYHYAYIIPSLDANQWDNVKETCLATSLPRQIVGASLVVKFYFDRWPHEEPSFRRMKAVGSLHGAAGYGEQRLPDLRARSGIVDGKRVLAPKGAQASEALGRRIRAPKRNVRAIQKANSQLRKLDRAEAEWMRLAVADGASSAYDRANNRTRKGTAQYVYDGGV